MMEDPMAPVQQLTTRSRAFLLAIAMLAVSDTLLAVPATITSTAALFPVHAFRSFDKRSAPDLPEGLIWDLLQADDGLLWISTLSGLATFDLHHIRAVHDAFA